MGFLQFEATPHAGVAKHVFKDFGGERNQDFVAVGYDDLDAIH